jgi:hypothetical protein
MACGEEKERKGKRKKERKKEGRNGQAFIAARALDVEGKKCERCTSRTRGSSMIARYRRRICISLN